jgi:hypothetical protein
MAHQCMSYFTRRLERIKKIQVMEMVKEGFIHWWDYGKTACRTCHGVTNLV